MTGEGPLGVKRNFFSLVIPCFNEAQAIPQVLRRCLEILPQLSARGLVDRWEIVVVDDASRDGSTELLKLYASRIRLICSPESLGYGGALKLGFQVAQGNLIAFMDMDATYDPQDFAVMLEKMQQSGCDVICGDRLSQLSGMPLTRTLGNLIFVKMINLLYRQTLRDSCTGSRVFRSSLKEVFTGYLPNHLNYSIAMTLLMLETGISFQEIPISYQKRCGRSKLSLLRDGFEFLSTILTFSFEKKSREMLKNVRKLVEELA